jgi:hypothetical protein
MGIRAAIYKHPRYAGCSNHGISEAHDEVTIVNADGPFPPTAEAPAAYLDKRSGVLRVVPGLAIHTCSHCGCDVAIETEGEVAKPHKSGPLPDGSMVDCVGAGKPTGLRYVRAPGWHMMGGSYVASSDSRFAEACEVVLGAKFYGAVALHDRKEG